MKIWKIKSIPAVLFIVGLSVMIASLTSWNVDTTEKSEPKYGGTYIYASSDKSEILNPRDVVWLPSKSALWMVYDPLISITKNLTLTPRICESWEMISNNTVFRCNVRKMVYFHNGKELTSKDIIFSLNYIAGPGALETEDFKVIKGAEDFWNGKKKAIDGIKANGPWAVEISLKKPFPSFASILASPRHVILPYNLDGKSETEFFANPIGSGPFKFYEQSENILKMKANDKYYGGRPYLDEVVIKTLSYEEALTDFKKGEISDLSAYVVTDSIENIPNAQIYPSDSYGTKILFVNNGVKPFNDINYRDVLFLSIDKERIVRECYPTAKTAYTLIPPSIVGHAGKKQEIKFDLEMVSRLVKNLSKERITIYYDQESLNECAVSVISETFKNISAPWSLETASSDILAKKFFSGNLKAHIETLMVKSEDAYTLLKYFESGSKENLARIKNYSIDRMLNDTVTMDDKQKRNELYKTVDSVISANKYALPLLYIPNYIIADNRFHGNENRVILHFIDFTKIWKEKEQH